jgi:hypothetical protein
MKNTSTQNRPFVDFSLLSMYKTHVKSMTPENNLILWGSPVAVRFHYNTVTHL